MGNCCEKCNPECTVKCEDCGKKYCEFPMDTTVSNDQWFMIHPECSDGILCVGCMVERGKNIRGVVAARLVFEVASAVEHSVQRTPSQEVLARDWDTPEEDEAWRGLGR